MMKKPDTTKVADKGMGIHLLGQETLESWLAKHTPECFPQCDPQKGEMRYSERYENVKRTLLPIHHNVEIGAMSAGAKKWLDEAIAIVEGKTDGDEIKLLLKQLIDSDPIVYLNNHGKGHVEKVIERVSEMLHFFEGGYLKPYEGFMLLCAIQIHDIGNVFGREEHEKRCREILDTECKSYMPDKFERRLIEKLALVHGGAFNGDKDTITYLTDPKTLYEIKVRKKLLAALLRFGDELADDSTRANREGIERGTILDGSRIYHHYSQALHTVKINRDSTTNKVQLELSYEFDTNEAAMKFKKNGDEKYLLDEIYDRTLKMERERRYCMRFLRPYLSIDAIKVEIIIQCIKPSDLLKSDKIQYTLEEFGYPDNPKNGKIKEHITDVRTGQEELEYLTKEWGL